MTDERAGGKRDVGGPARGGGLGRQLARNTAYAASGRVAALLVWLVLTPPILKALGPEGFGVWTLFYALTGYLSSLDFGLSAGTVRQVAMARARGHHEEGGAFATLALIGYASLGLAWLGLTAAFREPVLHWLRIPPASLPDARFAMTAGAGIFVLSGCAGILMAVAQGYQRFDVSNRVLLTLTAQQAVGIPFVLWRGWGLRGLVCNVGVGWLLAALVGWRLVRVQLPEFRWRGGATALRHWREALAFGGPMQITNLLSVTHTQLDKFLLVRFVALASVTPYELGFRIATTASALPQLLLLAVLPTVSQIHASSDARGLSQLFDRASRYVLAAAALAIGVLLGSADRLFLIWLGTPHVEAALAVRGLALTAGVALATGTGTSVARGIGRTDLEAWFALIALVVHGGLSLWLLPRMGLSGALLAILAGNIVGAIYFMSSLAHTLRWPVFRVVVRPLVVPICATGLGWAAGAALDRALPPAHGPVGWLTLTATSAASALVVAGVCFATGYVAWRELLALIRPQSASA
ncbi:MAG TPA: oligosaccharide flippase family protein [Candidatus Saccharimonadaceae bacterium]|jgi:O-antigen/teichoic acid export membrane protein|nr:oligosaccharide flippase family protein [Candidatus Saccharimonadaceae bacterium]